MVIGNCGSEYKNNINFGIRILCVQKMQGPVDPCIRKKACARIYLLPGPPCMPGPPRIPCIFERSKVPKRYVSERIT